MRIDLLLLLILLCFPFITPLIGVSVCKQWPNGTVLPVEKIYKPFFFFLFTLDTDCIRYRLVTQREHALKHSVQFPCLRFLCTDRNLTLCTFPQVSNCLECGSNKKFYSATVNA